MRIDGEWLQCDDGIVRPVIRAEIATAAGNWRAFELLVDTGADVTVLSANVLASLDPGEAMANARIGGIGGIVDSHVVQAQGTDTDDTRRRAEGRLSGGFCRLFGQ